MNKLITNAHHFEMEPDDVQNLLPLVSQIDNKFRIDGHGDPRDNPLIYAIKIMKPKTLSLLMPFLLTGIHLFKLL